MDAFYASVEELDDPTLKSKPMAVGGLGMVCTANYEARKFGIRAAMPGFIGRRLCPELVFAKPNFVSPHLPGTAAAAVGMVNVQLLCFSGPTASAGLLACACM